MKNINYVMGNWNAEKEISVSSINFFTHGKNSQLIYTVHELTGFSAVIVGL